MNEGKKFEDNFKKSIPTDTYYLRLHDSSIGFDIENSTQRFALKSPFDCILYRNGKMYCLELKSTKSTSVSYAGSSPMIKEHQINELIKANEFGCISGLIINFRNTENTYYLPIFNLSEYIKTAQRKSINESVVKELSVLIPSKKLKVNYRYDLVEFLGKEE